MSFPDYPTALAFWATVIGALIAIFAVSFPLARFIQRQSQRVVYVILLSLLATAFIFGMLLLAFFTTQGHSTVSKSISPSGVVGTPQTTTPTISVTLTTGSLGATNPIFINVTSGCQKNDPNSPSYLTVSLKSVTKTSSTDIMFDLIFTNASNAPLHLSFSNITIKDADSHNNIVFADKLPPVDIGAHDFTNQSFSFTGFDKAHTHHYAFNSEIRNDNQWACDFTPISFTVPGD